MFKLIIILVSVNGNISGVSVDGDYNTYHQYKTYDRCIAAGQNAQNNVVSFLSGETPGIAFTCVPTDRAINNPEAYNPKKE